MAFCAGVSPCVANRSHRGSGFVRSRGLSSRPPELHVQRLRPPMYGVFGQNAGEQTSYEIASPCIPKEVRDAAEATRDGRNKPPGQERHHDHVFRQGPLPARAPAWIS